MTNTNKASEQKSKRSRKISPLLKRNIEITVRVNQQELEQIKQRKQGKTMAGWLRQLALNVNPVQYADPDLVRALGRIGSNLNQISRQLNTNKQLDSQVLMEVKMIRQALHQLLANNLKDQN